MATRQGVGNINLKPIQSTSVAGKTHKNITWLRIIVTDVKKFKNIIQWGLFNGITDNGISWLMESN
jgi:hypothetical protein